MAAETESTTTRGGLQPTDTTDAPNNDLAQDAAMSTASSDDQIRDKVPPTPALSKGKRFKRHCFRRKWWYIGGVVILLAILLPILYVTCPNPNPV